MNGIGHRFKRHIRVGVIAFIWSLCLCRNDKVFSDKNSSILQVIYKGMFMEDRDLYMKVCVHLEATARNTFPQHG
jgi:hypothetical protein